jgi:hypothetical protein
LGVIAILINIRARAAFGLGESLWRVYMLGVRSGSLAMRDLLAVNWEVTDSNRVVGVRIGACERGQFK